MKGRFAGKGSRWEICKNAGFTGRDEHDGHEEGHLVWLQAHGAQLLAEVKHRVEQGAHPEGPQRRQRVRLAVEEGHRPLLGVKQRAEPHHQNLGAGRQVNVGLLRTGEKVESVQTYLEGAGFQQHDLVVLAEALEARDALGKFHNLSDGRGEALGEGVPHLLAGSAGRRHRTHVEGARL